MMGIGLMGIMRVMALIIGLMVTFTQVILYKVKKMVKECIYGLIVENLWGIGKMIH